jgi:hypothetical protein
MSLNENQPTPPVTQTPPSVSAVPDVIEEEWTAFRVHKSKHWDVYEGGRSGYSVLSSGFISKEHAQSIEKKHNASIRRVLEKRAAVAESVDAPEKDLEWTKLAEKAARELLHASTLHAIPNRDRNNVAVILEAIKASHVSGEPGAELAATVPTQRALLDEIDRDLDIHAGSCRAKRHGQALVQALRRAIKEIEIEAECPIDDLVVSDEITALLNQGRTTS